MQALSRRYADLPMEPGQVVRREYEYVRHGTQVLMGAYDVRTGKLFGFIEDRRGVEPFLALLDLMEECYPEGRGHIVCDNLLEHHHEDVEAWFEAHPRWKQHFTPKRSSWLNQIECAFSLLQRQVLRRGSFESCAALRDAVLTWMLWHNERAHPICWSYESSSGAMKPAHFSGQRH